MLFVSVSSILKRFAASQTYTHDLTTRYDVNGEREQDWQCSVCPNSLCRLDCSN